MANDTTHLDTAHMHGTGDADMAASNTHDTDFGAVQVAEATTPAAAPAGTNAPAANGQPVHIEVPAGQNVVRVKVVAGETVILPPGFDASHDLAAKEGNGNLAIKVGDVTVILQGYIEAANDPQHPVTVDGDDGKPIDIAVVLASTDPNLNIQTAAGPAVGAQGADQGHLLAQFGAAAGLGGFGAVGPIDQTELQYKLIDATVRQEFGPLNPNGPGGNFGFNASGPNGAMDESYLRDPANSTDWSSYAQFHTAYQNAGEDFGDFPGTNSKAADFLAHLTETVDVTTTSAPATVVLTDIANLSSLTSNGEHLSAEFRDNNETAFLYRDGDHALVAVVHVAVDPNDPTHFVMTTTLIDRLDDVDSSGNPTSSTTINVDYSVFQGTVTPTGNGDEGTTLPDGGLPGTAVFTVADDAPIMNASDPANNVVTEGDAVHSITGSFNFNYGADGPLNGTSLAKDATNPTELSLVITDKQSGDTYLTFENGAQVSSKLTSGGVEVDVAETHSAGHTILTGTAGGTTIFTIDVTDSTGAYTFDLEHAIDHPGINLGGNKDSFNFNIGATITDDDGDQATGSENILVDDSTPTVTPPPPPGPGDNPVTLNGEGTAVYEAGLSPNGSEAGKAGDPITTSGHVTITAPDGVASITVDGNTVDLTPGKTTTVDGTYGDVVVTWDSKNNELDYTYTLDKNDPNNKGQGPDIDVNGENFTVTATDKDGDSASGAVKIGIVDDTPTAKADADDVNHAAGSQTSGNVVTGVPVAGNTDSHLVADVLGADGAHAGGAVVGIVAGTSTDPQGGVGTTIQGTYGTLTIDAQGDYTYTVGKDGLPQGKSDVFTYTIEDGDGDLSSTQLTIGASSIPNIIQETPTGSPGEVTVYEAGLSNGSAPGNAADPVSASGTFKIDSHGEGFQYLHVGGVNVALNNTGVGTVVDTDHGKMTITSVTNEGNGAFDIGYSYTLSAPLTDAPGANSADLPPVPIEVKDTSGDIADSQLTVHVIDDNPTAHADVDTVNIAAHSQTAGNVVTGVPDAGNTDAHLAADVLGADGAHAGGAVVGVVAGTATGNPEGGVGTTIQGTYGSLVLDASGHYTYTVGNTALQQGDVDTFTYTIEDSDGDLSSTTLKIDVNCPTITQLPTTPDGTPGVVSVHESGLPDGTHPDATALVGTGSFDVNTHGEGLSGLTIDGVAVNLTGGDTVIKTDATGTMEITGVTDTNGDYTLDYKYTLANNIEESPAANNGPDSVPLPNYSIVATDKSGDQATSSITVNVVDDTPIAANGTKDLNGGGGNHNILLVLDMSNSMNDDSGVKNPAGGDYTKLQLEQVAIQSLLTQYEKQGDVSVHIVWFNDTDSSGQGGVGSNSGGWLSVADALTFVNGLTASSNTNYDIAVNQAENAFSNTTGYIANATNVAYFISDGMPNQAGTTEGGDGVVGITGQQLIDWQNFLTENHINSYAIGLGTGVGTADQASLNPLAYDGQNGTDPAGNTIIVTDLNQLTSVIDGTVPQNTAGNLIGDLGAQFGADGAGHINSVQIDGGALVTYAETASGNTHILTAVLAQGTVTINMDTGEYTYTPKAGTAQGEVDIAFNLVDGDGDVSNTAVLRLVNGGSGGPNVAPVIDSNGGGATATVSILEHTTAVAVVHATDANTTDTLAFAITGGADASLFSINSATGQLSFKNAPSYVAGKDYAVTVTVSDGHGGTDTQAITVSVDTAPVAGADHIYTTQTDTATVQDAWLLHNDTNGDGLPLSVTGTTNISNNPDLTATHDAAHSSIALTGLFGATQSNGETGSFGYYVSDGSHTETGTVAVTYESGTTIDRSSDTTGDIIIGSSASETLKGGHGDDVIVSGGGTDKIDGGAGFDTVNLAVNGLSIDHTTLASNFHNIELLDLGQGGSKDAVTLAADSAGNRLNAADVISMTSATGVNHTLFISGDASDNVSIQTSGTNSFKDAGSVTNPNADAPAGSYEHYTATVGTTTVDLYVEHAIAQHTGS